MARKTSNQTGNRRVNGTLNLRDENGNPTSFAISNSSANRPTATAEHPRTRAHLSLTGWYKLLSRHKIIQGT
ncbi:hypothetical protein ACROYT_G022609 [Oculina patagonica]